MSLNSCHTYEWESVCLHVTHMSVTCHTYECVDASLRCECVMSHVWIRKHERMGFRYVPAKQWGMTPMPPCVDTQCIAMCCSALQCVAVCCSVLRRPWMKEQRRHNHHMTLCRHATRSCLQKSTIAQPRSHVCKRALSLHQNSPIFTQKFPVSLQRSLISVQKSPEERQERERQPRQFHLPSIYKSPISLHKSPISPLYISTKERRRTGSAILCKRDLFIRPNT